MIYFIFNGLYCSADEINEQMAAKVQYITKEEYDAYIEKELSLNIELEESKEEEE